MMRNRRLHLVAAIALVLMLFASAGAYADTTVWMTPSGGYVYSTPGSGYTYTTHSTYVEPRVLTYDAYGNPIYVNSNTAYFASPGTTYYNTPSTTYYYSTPTTTYYYSDPSTTTTTYYHYRRTYQSW